MFEQVAAELSASGVALRAHWIDIEDEAELVGDYDDMMGHAGAVKVHPNGVIEGATDPRADGICAGL